MASAEEIWKLVKQLPFEEQSRLKRWAIEESDATDDKARLKALEEFLAGTKYRWIRTDRDQWHAR